MFSKIYLGEIKFKLKSLSMIILIVSICVFYYTQFIGDLERIGVKPVDYRIEDIVENISETRGITLEKMTYYTYETMKLDYKAGDTLRMKGINTFYDKISEEQRQVLMDAIKEIESREMQSNDEYYAFINKLDKALGGNTVYSTDNNIDYIIRSIHSQSNAEKYDKVLKEDKVTNAYGRLFADYIGITIGFFTVFITAFTFIKDRRYNTNELISTTKVFSSKYVLGKYFADISIITLVVLLVAGHATWKFHGFSKLTGDPISYTAFFKYSILWIVPTIMFVTSLSYVLQLVFNNGIVPIIFQFFYWNYSMSPIVIEGIKPTKYIIRFNKILPHTDFQSYMTDISINRIIFTILSLVLLFIAMKLWDIRRGDINSGFKLRKKSVS